MNHEHDETTEKKSVHDRSRKQAVNLESITGGNLGASQLTKTVEPMGQPKSPLEREIKLDSNPGFILGKP